MAAYYNEFDKGAAAWLRELIRRDLIAPGDVDERSIEDVRPDDLRSYTQHHFFAGIGGWSYALRLAGWPDDRPVWTGSCPCQPFSSAGKGAGFDDQRHLWPAFFHLIRECRPAVVFGEQVASKDADVWIDLVQADMEGMGHAFGCVPFPSAGVGAPHIRDRNYWVGVGLADAHQQGLEGWQLPAERAAERAAGSRGVAGGMADSESKGLPHRGPGTVLSKLAKNGGIIDRLGDPDCSTGRQGSAIDGRRHPGGDAFARPGPGGDVVPDSRHAGPLHGFWRAADWLLCRDGKWRPVEPGSFPLADGLPARVVRLRGYGNAINPHQAAEFIHASGLMDEST